MPRTSSTTKLRSTVRKAALNSSCLPKDFVHSGLPTRATLLEPIDHIFIQPQRNSSLHLFGLGSASPHQFGTDECICFCKPILVEVRLALIRFPRHFSYIQELSRDVN